MSGNDTTQDNTNENSKWTEWGVTDILVLLLLVTFGVVVPDLILDNLDAWKQRIPGQEVELQFEMNNTIYYSHVWLEDPSYGSSFKEDETVNGNELFAMTAILPPIYIFLYLYILTLIKIPDKPHKRFLKHWLWYEFITFGYAFIIAQSINYWGNKLLKLLVSMPIPDFYERCDLDTSDINDLHCINNDESEIIKSWKSFPSGHSSNLFTSGTVLVLYTWNKLNLFDTIKIHFLEHNWFFRSCIDFLLTWPIFLACWGAFTRVTDHVHTPTDVLGGACLGYCAGRLGYYSQYKPGSPWSYRLLFWPEVRSVIEKHSTLKRKMYPKLFEKSHRQLLEEMTRYRFEERGNKKGDGNDASQQRDSPTNNTTTDTNTRSNTTNTKDEIASTTANNDKTTEMAMMAAKK